MDNNWIPVIVIGVLTILLYSVVFYINPTHRVDYTLFLIPAIMGGAAFVCSFFLMKPGAARNVLLLMGIIAAFVVLAFLIHFLLTGLSQRIDEAIRRGGHH